MAPKGLTEAPWLGAHEKKQRNRARADEKKVRIFPIFSYLEIEIKTFQANLKAQSSSFETRIKMAIIGKLFHYSFDLVLVSTALAGIKRNTGLTPKTELLGKDFQPYFQKYLDLGESTYDSTIGVLNASGYFVRK